MVYDAKAGLCFESMSEVHVISSVLREVLGVPLIESGSPRGIIFKKKHRASLSHIKVFCLF